MTTEEEIIDIGDTGSSTESPSTLSTIHEQTSTDPTFQHAQDNHEWGSSTYTDMDSESRALIEQMLAEEEFYYGKNTMATIKRQKKSDGTPKKKTGTKKRKVDSSSRDYTGDKTTVISSASLPSHKTRWTSEEDNHLKLALEKFGYGNWKLIAEFVKTRNPLQCKNRARHWAVYDKDNLPTSSSPMVSANTAETTKIQQNDADTIDQTVLPTNATEIITKKDDDDAQIDSNASLIPDIPPANDDDDDDENISVEDDGGLAALPAPLTVKEESEDDTKTIMKSDTATTTGDISDGNNTSDSNDSDRVMESKQQDDINNDTPVQKEQPQLDSIPSATTEFKKQNAMNQSEQTSAGDTKTKVIPSSNQENDDLIMSFDPYIISQEEKINNPEWFNNKQSKTPDRYLKIRNHMLNCWRSCRPRYLTKTSSRKALKDCGDVNAIGRVHSYLENIGAINVNCTNAAPRPPRRNSLNTAMDTKNFGNGSDEDEDLYAAADFLIGYDGPRKRKVRNEKGEWVDPKELEGRVIEHGQPKSPVVKSRRIIKRSQHYYGGDDFGRGYDPFRLVPVEYYDDHYAAPFTVEITSNSLLVMDFHSHLAHTEIIGLLGGTYETDTNDGRKRLVVKSVFPCKSTSTGIQCEMDPESEMKARDVFAANGYIVVGWYHSHPTFEPHPSIRDIENQTSYQTLFRHEKTGDEPFIGVIVTPYDLSIASDQSQIQYLHISNQWTENHTFRVPYACRRVVSQDDQVPRIVMDQMKELVDEFKDYEHKMNMLSTYGTRSRLDKLLDSLRSNLFMELGRANVFLDFVRSLMLGHFVDDEDKRTQKVDDDGPVGLESQSQQQQQQHQMEPRSPSPLSFLANPPQ